MSAPHYVVRRNLYAYGDALYRDEPGSADECVAEMVSDGGPELARFLAEAHNAYVPALQALIKLLHVDAIPESWRGERGPLSIREVAERIAELVPADSIGAPAPERAEVDA